MKYPFSHSLKPILALSWLLRASALSCVLLTPADLMAQAQPRTRQVIPSDAMEAMNASSVPQAYVLTVNGKCEYSENGTTFLPLKAGHLFNEGAVIRTTAGGSTDLFFRRMGTTVRVQPGTEIKLEKMERNAPASNPTMHALVDLRTGRLFSIVRSAI